MWSPRAARAGACCDDASVAKQDEDVAPLASSMTWLETGTRCRPAGSKLVEHVPEIAPEDRVEPTVGSSRTSRSGCPSSAATERDARRLSAREGAGYLVRMAAEVNGADRLFHPAARRTEDGSEVLEILADRQVRVDRRSLCDVADAAAQGLEAGRLAKDMISALDDLHPDELRGSASSCRIRSGRASR